MFLKPFKKALSLFVALVFVLSLVPTVGMAEEKTDIIPISDLANTRASKANDTGVVAWSGKDTIKLQCDEANNANHWRAYGKFNLSGYEEILANEDTEIVFEMTLGGHEGSHTQTDILIYLMNDSCDGFTKESITFNKAAELGLHDLDKNGVKIGDVYRDDDTQYTRTDVYSLKIPATTILNTLKQGKDDSVITFAFYTDNADGDSGKLAFFRGNTAKLTIKYDDSKINNKAYAQEIADGIKWSDLSNEELNSVTQKLNLPAKLYGADVTWSSYNNVIASDGTVNQTYENQDVVLTASVSYKGETATAVFDVTVDNKKYEYEGVYTGENPFYTPASNVNGTQISIESNIPGIAGKDAGDVIYNVHDITDGAYINYMVNNTIPELNNDVIEFSICLPAGSPDVTITAGVFNSTGGTGAGSQSDKTYKLTTNGFFYGSEKIFETEANKWYTMAYVAPKGMKTVGTPTNTDDKTGEVYINGELIDIMTFNTPTSYGFRYFRFIGNDASLEDTGYYLDNVRWFSGEYIPKYDALANLSSNYINASKNSITVKEATVASLKASVSKDDDTNLRIYDKSGKLLTDENATVLDGYTLVAAARNGTNMERSYAYYNIKVTENTCAFDIPQITVEGNEIKSEIKLYNNTNDDAQYTAYLAIYSGGELINLTSSPISAPSGDISTTTITADISSGNTAKLMIWKDMIPQIIAVTK